METTYNRVLPYETMSREIRNYKETMPESMHEALDDLAAALELATSNVHDRSSERSHFANIVIAFNDVLAAIPLDVSHERLWLLGEVAGQIDASYDVLGFQEQPETGVEIPESYYKYGNRVVRHSQATRQLQSQPKPSQDPPTCELC